MKLLFLSAFHQSLALVQAVDVKVKKKMKVKPFSIPFWSGDWRLVCLFMSSFWVVEVKSAVRTEGGTHKVHGDKHAIVSEILR